MSFYDKMKNYPYFVFDRYYPNRYEMDKGVETDGVLVGRYVYIDYTLKNNADYNANIDIEHYKIPQNGRTNHQTVWQKTWINNKLEYRLIAEFQPNEDKPGLNLVPFAPSFLPNAQKLQTQMIYNGLGNGYTLRWQDPYQMRFRGLYDEHGNPIDFANIKGFDIKESHKVDGLNKFDVSTEESGTLYYEETADGGRMTTKPDTLVFDIALPGIGNAVSALYDILLAQDRELIKTLDELEELINENQVTEDYQKYIYIDKNNPTALRRLVKTDDDEWVTEEFLVLDLPLLSTDGTRMNSALSLIKNLYDRYREVEESKVFLTQMQVMNMIQPFSEDWVSDDFIGPVFMLGLEDAATVCEGTCEFDGTNKVHNITLLGNLKPSQKVGSVILRACKTFTKGEKISLIADELADTATKGLLANMTNLSLYAQNNTEAEDNIFWYGAVLTLNYDLENRKVYICSTETEKNTEDEPTEHVHTLVHYEAVDATCTEEGNIEYWRCTSCGKYYSDAAGLNEITENSVIIAKLPHTWGKWSEHNDEKHIHTCSVCGTTETQSHDNYYGDWTEKDDYEHERTCSRCEHRDTENHNSDSYDYNEEYHWDTCSACGKQMSDDEAHSLGDWEFDNEYHYKTCSVCGGDVQRSKHDLEWYGDGAGHYAYCLTCPADLLNSAPCEDTNNDGRCDVCDATMAAHTHVWKDATCTEPKTCKVCGATEGKARGHDWGEWHDWGGGTIGRDCSRCPATKSEEHCSITGNHKWENVISPDGMYVEGKKCTACGKTVDRENVCMHNSTYESAPAVPATCETTGTTATIKCWDCGKTFGGNTIPKKAHSYSTELNINYAATCTEAGEGYYTCTQCYGQSPEVKIPATGHRWGPDQSDGANVWHVCQNCGETESLA